MSLIMDVLEKPGPAAAVFSRENEPLKGFFETPAPGRVLKPEHPGSARPAFPTKKVLVTFLIAFAAVSAGSVAWYFFAGPNTAGSSTHTNFSWSTPRSAGAASVSRPVPTGTAGTAVLQGVLLDPTEPLCLIAGKVLKVGDSLEGRKITAITDQGVSLTDKQGNASFIGITN